MITITRLEKAESETSFNINTSANKIACEITIITRYNDANSVVLLTDYDSAYLRKTHHERIVRAIKSKISSIMTLTNNETLIIAQ